MCAVRHVVVSQLRHSQCPPSTRSIEVGFDDRLPRGFLRPPCARTPTRCQRRLRIEPLSTVKSRRPVWLTCGLAPLSVQAQLERHRRTNQSFTGCKTCVTVSESRAWLPCERDGLLLLGRQNLDSHHQLVMFEFRFFYCPKTSWSVAHLCRSAAAEQEPRSCGR